MALPLSPTNLVVWVGGIRKLSYFISFIGQATKIYVQLFLFGGEKELKEERKIRSFGAQERFSILGK